jgi:hypothetical protein
MKNLVKTTKLFLILFLTACVQKTNLNAMATLRDRCVDVIVQNIDVDNFIEGVILGDAKTLELLDVICQTAKNRQAFANALFPDLTVEHKNFWILDDGIIAVSWSSDGKYIASKSYGSVIRVWVARTGEYVAFFNYAK